MALVLDAGWVRARLGSNTRKKAGGQAAQARPFIYIPSSSPPDLSFPFPFWAATIVAATCS